MMRYSFGAVLCMFFACVYSGDVLIGRASKSKIYPIGTGFPHKFPDHISDEILSSLVYVRLKNRLLCSGALFSTTRAIFYSQCLKEMITRNLNYSFSEYIVETGSITMPDFNGQYSIKHVEYKVYASGNCERSTFYGVIMLTEEVRFVETIRWPMNAIQNQSPVVSGGWDKGGEFRMYYVDKAEVNEFKIYIPPDSDGFVGDFLFQEKKLVGFFTHFICDDRLISGDSVTKDVAEYIQVEGYINVHFTYPPLNWLTQRIRRSRPVG